MTAGLVSWLGQVQATDWWRQLVARRGEQAAFVELQKQIGRQRWEALRTAARENVNVFMTLCFRNDQDPAAPPFEQQWFHREWQRIWGSERLSCMHGATGFGKTDQVVGHILWRLGRNPKLRVVLFGKKEDNAKRLLQKIKRQIEKNAIVRAIFPELRPSEPWSGEKLRLEGAGLDITTNNVEVYGLTGSPQGVRGDFLLLDDVIDLDNTRTEDERKKTIEFVDTVVQSRQTTFGQLHIIANAWHAEDLAFTYAKRPGVTYRCYPAEDPTTGALLWPSFRPKVWLNQVKASMTPARYTRMYLCVPNTDETRLFEEEWFARAKTRGQSTKPLREIQQAHNVHANDPAFLHLAFAAEQTRLRIVVAMDLATGRKARRRKSDLTVFFVVALHPSGDRQILWVEAGRWGAPVSLAKMVEYQQRYHPDRFIVESNAAQIFLTQFARELETFDAAIDEFETTDLKWDEDLGIEEIGIELQAGRWILPGPAAGEERDAYLLRLTPEERDAQAAIDQAAQRLLDFSRQGHTPDDVMAWYFAKEGIKRLLTGTFSHRNARPAEQAAREQAGPAGTMAALFPAMPPLLSAPLPSAPLGLHVPSPYEPTTALATDAEAPVAHDPYALPRHVREILGLPP